ncbi:glucose-1-phosphate thymidylyltransferase [Streptomyces sp. NBC_00094]|uniref:glucose-1-phosphate thymidylyltransferase n=1 Tax=Streptomyces sp. NBC_00094 TaxID=2903620 RepID=UPI00225286A6|nr:glucose-1-phosphate thymidylyltransferase [Streptomyces sp. NBC_00094]MCX5388958.1 glucose-1-phosphate thymidylyltransferase [Streptomyces sp. NBC_00094]
MKALVLAGGTGSRLRPFTHTGTKQLLPIANKPVLFYGLEAIAAAGIHDVGLIVGEYGEDIRRAVGDGASFGLRITYVRQERPLGLAHAVLVAREFLADDDFLVYLGDNYLQDGIAEFVRRAADEPAAARLLVTPVPDPTAFGVAEVDGAGLVVRVEEKPPCPRGDLALIGVYAFTPALHEAVRAIRPSARGELEITTAIQWLIDHGLDVRAENTTSVWRDTGSVDDMLEVNRHVLDGLTGRLDGKVDQDSAVVGRVSLAEGAVVRGSRIVGPVIIGPGSVISNAVIGPYTSIGANCRVRDSSIEASVLLDGADVEHAGRIERSFIGRDAVVAAPPFPYAHRLVLGDHSKVHLNP